MARLTDEQIVAKKQQLKELISEAMKLKDELVHVGAWPLDDDILEQVLGGTGAPYVPGGAGGGIPGSNDDGRPRMM